MTTIDLTATFDAAHPTSPEERAIVMRGIAVDDGRVYGRMAVAGDSADDIAAVAGGDWQGADRALRLVRDLIRAGKLPDGVDGPLQRAARAVFHQDVPAVPAPDDTDAVGLIRTDLVAAVLSTPAGAGRIQRATWALTVSYVTQKRATGDPASSGDPIGVALDAWHAPRGGQSMAESMAAGLSGWAREILDGRVRVGAHQEALAGVMLAECGEVAFDADTIAVHLWGPAGVLQ